MMTLMRCPECRIVYAFAAGEASDKGICTALRFFEFDEDEDLEVRMCTTRLERVER